jgi:hypothetical protein
VLASYHLSHSFPSLFFSYFSGRVSHFGLELSWPGPKCPTYAFYIAGTTGADHHLGLLIKMRSHFVQFSLEVLPSQSVSWVAGIIAVSHHAQHTYSFLTQGLTMYPSLASNLWPFCLSLQSAGITEVCHHAWITHLFLVSVYLAAVIIFPKHKIFLFFPIPVSFHNYLPPIFLLLVKISFYSYNYNEFRL